MPKEALVLTLISPAKRLDFESEMPDLDTTTPTLLEDTQAPLKVTGQLSATDLSDLMKIKMRSVSQLFTLPSALRPSDHDGEAGRDGLQGDVYSASTLKPSLAMTCDGRRSASVFYRVFMAFFVP